MFDDRYTMSGSLTASDDSVSVWGCLVHDDSDMVIHVLGNIS